MIRLSRNQLKFIAAALMFVDHLGIVAAAPDSLSYVVMRRILGRMAYPMFCALFVDGFWRTKRPWRHVVDLLIFGFLSEFAFDFVSSRGSTWFLAEHQNVMFSWAIGFLMMMGLDFALDSPKVDRFARPPLCILIVFVCMCVAAACRVDYDAIGVTCVLVCYIAKRNLGSDVELWHLTLLISICLVFGFKTWGVLLAPLPMFFYDGNLDHRPKTLIGKYSCYAFYPLHLMLISAGVLLFR